MYSLRARPDQSLHDLADDLHLTKAHDDRRNAVSGPADESHPLVSELTSLNCGDVTLGTGANVRCEGKGRNQRAVPLSKPVETLLRPWLTERAGHPADPLFPTRTGRRLSRAAGRSAHGPQLGIVAVSA
jgi:site-specific recombinase XerC